jgi:hypothetical protein
MLQSPDHPVSLRKYLLTTEAHLLPINAGQAGASAVRNTAVVPPAPAPAPAPAPVVAPVVAPAAVIAPGVSSGDPHEWKGLILPNPWPLEANTGGCDGWWVVAFLPSASGSLISFAILKDVC